MTIQRIAAVALLISSVAYGPTTITQAAPIAVEARSMAQALPSNFTRPEVKPLPPEGKFQVVSDTAWSGNKVRVFFLGAQF